MRLTSPLLAELHTVPSKISSHALGASAFSAFLPRGTERMRRRCGWAPFSWYVRYAVRHVHVSPVQRWFLSSSLSLHSPFQPSGTTVQECSSSSLSRTGAPLALQEGDQVISSPFRNARVSPFPSLVASRKRARTPLGPTRRRNTTTTTTPQEKRQERECGRAPRFLWSSLSRREKHNLRLLLSRQKRAPFIQPKGGTSPPSSLSSSSYSQKMGSKKRGGTGGRYGIGSRRRRESKWKAELSRLQTLQQTARRVLQERREIEAILRGAAPKREEEHQTKRGSHESAGKHFSQEEKEGNQHQDGNLHAAFGESYAKLASILPSNDALDSAAAWTLSEYRDPRTELEFTRHLLHSVLISLASPIDEAWDPYDVKPQVFALDKFIALPVFTNLKYLRLFCGRFGITVRDPSGVLWAKPVEDEETQKEWKRIEAIRKSSTPSSTSSSTTSQHPPDGQSHRPEEEVTEEKNARTRHRRDPLSSARTTEEQCEDDGFPKDVPGEAGHHTATRGNTAVAEDEEVHPRGTPPTPSSPSPIPLSPLQLSLAFSSCPASSGRPAEEGAMTHQTTTIITTDASVSSASPTGGTAFLYRLPPPYHQRIVGRTPDPSSISSTSFTTPVRTTTREEERRGEEAAASSGFTQKAMRTSSPWHSARSPTFPGEATTPTVARRTTTWEGSKPRSGVASSTRTTTASPPPGSTAAGLTAEELFDVMDLSIGTEVEEKQEESEVKVEEGMKHSPVLPCGDASSSSTTTIVCASSSASSCFPSQAAPLAFMDGMEGSTTPTMPETVKDHSRQEEHLYHHHKGNDPPPLLQQGQAMQECVPRHPLGERSDPSPPPLLWNSKRRDKRRGRRLRTSNTQSIRHRRRRGETSGTPFFRCSPKKNTDLPKHTRTMEMLNKSEALFHPPTKGNRKEKEPTPEEESETKAKRTGGDKGAFSPPEKKKNNPSSTPTSSRRRRCRRERRTHLLASWLRQQWKRIQLRRQRTLQRRSAASRTEIGEQGHPRKRTEGNGTHQHSTREDTKRTTMEAEESAEDARRVAAQAQRQAQYAAHLRTIQPFCIQQARPLPTFGRPFLHPFCIGYFADVYTLLHNASILSRKVDIVLNPGSPIELVLARERTDRVLHGRDGGGPHTSVHSGEEEDGVGGGGGEEVSSTSGHGLLHAAYLRVEQVLRREFHEFFRHYCPEVQQASTACVALPPAGVCEEDEEGVEMVQARMQDPSFITLEEEERRSEGQAHQKEAQRKGERRKGPRVALRGGVKKKGKRVVSCRRSYLGSRCRGLKSHKADGSFSSSSLGSFLSGEEEEAEASRTVGDFLHSQRCQQWQGVEERFSGGATYEIVLLLDSTAEAKTFYTIQQAKHQGILLGHYSLDIVPMRLAASHVRDMASVFYDKRLEEERRAAVERGKEAASQHTGDAFHTEGGTPCHRCDGKPFSSEMGRRGSFETEEPPPQKEESASSSAMERLAGFRQVGRTITVNPAQSPDSFFHDPSNTYTEPHAVFLESLKTGNR